MYKVSKRHIFHHAIYTAVFVDIMTPVIIFVFLNHFGVHSMSYLLALASQSACSIFTLNSDMQDEHSCWSRYHNKIALHDRFAYSWGHVQRYFSQKCVQAKLYNKIVSVLYVQDLKFKGAGVIGAIFCIRLLLAHLAHLGYFLHIKWI